MQVVHELASRLRVGGVWYNRGDAVLLDENDAAALAGRGLSSPARPGVIPKNAPSVPASTLGIVTKEHVGDTVSVPVVKEPQRGHSGKRR